MEGVGRLLDKRGFLGPGIAALTELEPPRLVPEAHVFAFFCLFASCWMAG